MEVFLSSDLSLPCVGCCFPQHTSQPMGSGRRWHVLQIPLTPSFHLYPLEKCVVLFCVTFQEVTGSVRICKGYRPLFQKKNAATSIYTCVRFTQRLGNTCGQQKGEGDHCHWNSPQTSLGIWAAQGGNSCIHMLLSVSLKLSFYSFP